MKRAIIISISCAILSLAFAQCSSKKNSNTRKDPNAKEATLAVLLFDNNSTQPNASDHKYVIQNTLIAELANEPNITVLERTYVNQILAEIEKSQSGLTSGDLGFKAGKMLNAESILIGSIDNFDIKKSETGFFLVGDLSKLRIQVDLSARIVHVETGRILAASRITLKNSEIDVKNFLIFGSHKEKIDEKAMKSSLMREAVLKLSLDLKEKLGAVRTD